MNNEKEKIMKLGNYTINSMFIKPLLESNESNLLDVLIYFDDINQKYISTSLLQIYTSNTKMTVLKMKNNLIKLNFISIIKETVKGTIFKIEWKNILEIIEILSFENNIVKRLIISDKYRVEKGLKTINQKNIETFLNSPFDFDYVKNKKNEVDESEKQKPKKEFTNKPEFKLTESLINQFNAVQKFLDDITLEQSAKNNYMNELNRLKNVCRQKNIKINFNKNTKTWN